MEMVECLNEAKGKHPQESSSLHTEPHLKQSLNKNQFVLYRSNTMLNGPSKDQDLEKLVEGIDELNTQMIELKSFMTKMGSLDPTRPPNNGFQLSTYFQPTTFPIQKKNLHPNSYPCLNTFQPPLQTSLSNPTMGTIINHP